MKANRIGLLAALLLLLFAAHFPSHAESIPELQGLLKLPESLRVIEREAFQGVGAQGVYMPHGTEYIGDMAFADAPNLSTAYIPPSAIFIGEDVFRGAADLTIIGVQGSPAEDWAKAHGYKFVHMDVWHIAGQRSFGIERRDYRLIGQPSDDVVLAAAIPRRHSEDGCLTNFPKEMPMMYPLDYDFP